MVGDEPWWMTLIFSFTFWKSSWVLSCIVDRSKALDILLPLKFLNLSNFHWPWDSEYGGKLCDGHRRKWVGINWQPKCFPISWKLFRKANIRSAKYYLKAFWRQHFVALCMTLTWNCIFFQRFSIITFCKPNAGCTLTLGQNVFVKNSCVLRNHQYEKLCIICMFNFLVGTFNCPKHSDSTILTPEWGFVSLNVSNVNGCLVLALKNHENQIISQIL